MFSCEDDQYDRTIFGSFDGLTSWQANLFVHESPLRQEVVSRHEERHLRLQKGTVWGVAAICVGLDAPPASRAQKSWMLLVDASRRTHESYATWFSVRNVDPGLETLRGNLVYLAYLREARRMREAFDADDTDADAVLEFLFHLIMCPASLADVTLRELVDPEVVRDRLLRHSPDARLRVLQTSLDRDGGLASRLLAAIRDDRGDVTSRSDATAAVLTEIGMPTLTLAAQESVARALADQLNSASTTFRVTLSVRSRATSLEDQLDYQSFERASLQRDRMPLAIAPVVDETGHPLAPYLRGDPALGAHVWMVWLPRAMMLLQFDVPDDELSQDHVLGLLAADRTRDVPGASFLPIDESPSDATDYLLSLGIDVVALTTVSALAKTHADIRFSPSAPLFVLVDQPLLPTLKGFAEPGVSVLWSPVEVSGDRDLHVLVFRYPNGHPVRFLHLTTLHGFRSAIEWLARHDGFERADEQDETVVPHLSALIRHITGTFAHLAALR